MMIHTFLCSYNPHDAYRRIEYWDQNWDGAEIEADEAFCTYCDDYGHTVDDCDHCYWCEYCDRYEDHPTDECPSIQEEENEQQIA